MLDSFGSQDRAEWSRVVLASVYLDEALRAMNPTDPAYLLPTCKPRRPYALKFLIHRYSSAVLH